MKYNINQWKKMKQHAKDNGINVSKSQQLFILEEFSRKYQNQNLRI